MRALNIIFFTHYAEMYGANYSMLRLISELKDKNGINPVVIMPKRGSLVKKLREQGIPYLCIRFKGWMRKDNSKQPHFEEWLEMVCNNAMALKDIEIQLNTMGFIPDVIVSVTSMIDVGMLYARWKKKKHIWFIRECNEQYKFSNIYPKYISRLWWRQSDRIVCISRFALEEFRKTYGYIGNEIILYNGVDIVPHYERKWKEKGDIIKFCIVGLISENKGQYFVTKCFQELYRMGCKEFELYIIGGGSREEIRKIKEICKPVEFGEKIRVMGYREDVKEILSQMDVGITASYKEMFGRVTVEYMMAGMPVIASASGANEEIVEDGRTGFIYTIYDEQDFIQKAKGCIEHPENLWVLGERGRHKAIEQFSKGKNAEGFKNILYQVIECR